jgi:hypothetical protein
MTGCNSSADAMASIGCAAGRRIVEVPAVLRKSGRS